MPGGDVTLELLSVPDAADGAAPVYDRILRRIREARRTLVIHMFVWRADAVGHEIGRAVLEAAERGVTVVIRKDVGAFMYERIEMNRKSLFAREVPLRKRALWRVVGFTFPDTFVRDDYTSDLGRRLLEHPQVTVDWVDRTHVKYYIVDGRWMILGSVNVEDRHRGYHDYMVEIEGEEAVRRHGARASGRAGLDASLPFDFVLNDVSRRPPRLEIKAVLLDLLARAGKSVHVEMAYLGDPDVTAGLLAAASRGVAVTVLLSRKANVGNDLNLLVARRLLRHGGIGLRLSDTMLHSKMMLFDGEAVLLGSANVSVFSMRKAGELDIVVRRDPAFVEAVRTVAGARFGRGTPAASADDLPRFSSLLALGQQIHQRLT
jgi:phosphatidylserine/phosphatidylglycerophosphate/cardiolipin synthase-like enzyme